MQSELQKLKKDKKRGATYLGKGGGWPSVAETWWPNIVQYTERSVSTRQLYHACGGFIDASLLAPCIAPPAAELKAHAIGAMVSSGRVSSDIVVMQPHMEEQYVG